MGSAETLDAYVRRRLLPYLAQANQGALAESTGLRQQQISRYKTGQWKNPPLEALDRLARAFDLTLSAILAELPFAGARADWQIDLYAAVAALSKDEALPVTWVARRARDSRVETASHGSPRGGPKASSGQTKRKRRATA